MLLFLSRTLFIIPSPPVLVPHAVAFIQHHFSFLFQFFCQMERLYKTYIYLKPEACMAKEPRINEENQQQEGWHSCGVVVTLPFVQELSRCGRRKARRSTCTSYRLHAVSSAAITQTQPLTQTVLVASPHPKCKISDI